MARAFTKANRGSLVPYKSEENQLHPVLALLGPDAPVNFAFLGVSTHPFFRFQGRYPECYGWKKGQRTDIIVSNFG